MRSGFTHVLVLVGLLSLAAGRTVSAEPAPIHFGSVAMDTPAVMHRRLTPLTDYLTRELGRPVLLKLSANMTDAINEVAANNVQLAYLTPVAYIKAHDRGNSQLVAKMVTNGQGSFQLMIVVREDSPIRTIDDLTGKSFAFGDPAALLQKATVAGAGVDLDKLARRDYLGHYDNIARAVLRGFYDAGILKDTTALKWQNKGLRILHASPHLPPYNVAASSALDAQTLEAIRRAFLRLDPQHPDHRAIIKALDKKYDGFAATDDGEYDVVRRLVKPFAKW